jgi:Phage gp6-like head-tail connector protein
MALIDEIATMAEVDLTKHQNYLNVMIPALLEKAQEYCNNTFDVKNPPGGVKVFLAESIQHKLNTKGLFSRTMGSVSYSFDTEVPVKVLRHLKPYRKVRF